MTVDCKEHSKLKIRQQLLDRRKAMPANQIALLSRQICARFSTRFAEVLKQLPQSRGLSVGMYRSLPSELDLRFLEPTLIQLGCRLHFPRVVNKQDKLLEFVEIPADSDPSSLWQLGSYGIEEPRPELKASLAEHLQMILVPGVAFSEQGNRIGMGAGYYDRFLPSAPKALRVALIFDFQIQEKLYQDSWDQGVHWILSEKREFKTPFLENWLQNPGDQQ